MTDETMVLSCDQANEELSELALGILSGRRREQVLRHVGQCARCRGDLESLSAVADTLIHLAPEKEPPVGFEVRLFDRAGVRPPVEPSPRRPGRRWRVPAVMTLAAAMVLVALGFGAGWFSAPGRPTGGTSSAVGAGAVRTAELRGHGGAGGRVTLSGGTSPWMVMQVSDAGRAMEVTCEVTTIGGTTERIGRFWLSSGGYGSWGSPLPVPAAAVAVTKVVGPNGKVLATATFAT